MNSEDRGGAGVTGHSGWRTSVCLLLISGIFFGIGAFPIPAMAESKWGQAYGGLVGLRGAGTDNRANIEYAGFGGQLIWQFNPRYGIDAEGSYGLYFIEDYRSIAYGISFAGRVNLFPVGQGHVVYSLGGGGLHLRNGGYSPWVGGSDWLAKLRTGISLFMPLGRRGHWSIGYRFEHVSDPYTRKDFGLNYHCLMAGIYLDLF